MASNRIARRYARALFEAARQERDFEQIIEDAVAMKELLNRSGELLAVLLNPAVSGKVKMDLVMQIFQDMLKVHPYLLNFVKILMKKHREAVLLDALTEFYTMSRSYQGFVQGELITATRIDDRLKNQIAEVLQKKFGLKFELEHKVDPSILGGFVIRFEDRLVDASIRRNLEKLKERIIVNEI